MSKRETIQLHKEPSYFKYYVHSRTIIAQLKLKNEYLTSKVASIKPKGRRPVYKDPNDGFANYID